MYGHVAGWPLAFRRGHHRNAQKPILERLWTKVDKSGECWNWTGRTHRFGYGEITFNGEKQGTHRVAWVLANGPIPTGLSVLHRCDNPRCVRPDHLFLGTQTDNQRDMREKGRHIKGSRHPHARLTETEAIEIQRSAGVSALALARKYGVSKVTVRNIQLGRRWKCLQQGGVQ